MRRMLGAMAILLAACSSDEDLTRATPRQAAGNGESSGKPSRESDKPSPGAEGPGSSGGPDTEESAAAPTPPNFNQSGSRLKVMFIEGADGSRESVGTFFDSTRKEECVFARHASGGRRCIPLAAVGVAPYSTSAGCTDRLAYVEPKGAAPKYLMSFDGGYRIYAAGAVHMGSVYSANPSSCQEMSREPAFPGTFYTVGAEIPPSEFEAGELKHAE